MPLRASSHPGSPNSPSCSALAWYSCWPGLSPWGESWKRTRVARTVALTRYRYATQPTKISQIDQTTWLGKPSGKIKVCGLLCPAGQDFHNEIIGLASQDYKQRFHSDRSWDKSWLKVVEKISCHIQWGLYDARISLVRAGWRVLHRRLSYWVRGLV